MNKLTAEKCRHHIDRLSDGGEQRCLSIYEEDYLQALEIALPVLEQTHVSIIAEQLEEVRYSLTLDPHQNAIIGLAISRLNQQHDEVIKLSRSLFDQQEPHPATTPQIDNDVWIEWKGGECPVSQKALVVTKWSDGQIIAQEASEPDWGYDEGEMNIIAYRVIENDGNAK